MVLLDFRGNKKFLQRLSGITLPCCTAIECKTVCVQDKGNNKVSAYLCVALLAGMFFTVLQGLKGNNQVSALSINNKFTPKVHMIYCTWYVVDVYHAGLRQEVLSSLDFLLLYFHSYSNCQAYASRSSYTIKRLRAFPSDNVQKGNLSMHSI